MAVSSQHADERVIRAEGEVLAPDQPLPRSSAENPARPPTISGRFMRFLTALTIAVLADLTQLVLLPLFGEGIVSPLNDALDVMVALVMITLLGFHWQFLPSFLSELVPVLNVAPVWTIAVLWVRRNERRADDPVAS